MGRESRRPTVASFGGGVGARWYDGPDGRGTGGHRQPPTPQLPAQLPTTRTAAAPPAATRGTARTQAQARMDAAPLAPRTTGAITATGTPGRHADWPAAARALATATWERRPSGQRTRAAAVPLGGEGEAWLSGLEEEAGIRGLQVVYPRGGGALLVETGYERVQVPAPAARPAQRR